ncbi:MAG: hypothetical protein DCC67_10995 [Planctomycetota bacterium]|nr:MAG: hypothetical protein DCC67_10995 [Planctomycetota bacterium]
MTRQRPFLLAIAMLLACSSAATGEQPKSFTRLLPLEATVVAAAAEFPGGAYAATNVLKPAANELMPHEYASHGQGEQTFIDFDLGRPETIAAFRHVQRGTVDLVARSELLFSDDPDFSRETASARVEHVQQGAGATFLAFSPVKARYVRWRVAELADGRYRNVGARSLQFFAAGDAEPAPRGIGIAASTKDIIARDGDALTQPLQIALEYPYAESTRASLHVDDQPPREIELHYGSQTIEVMIPRTDSERAVEIAVAVNGAEAARQAIDVAPARELVVYVLPHSHTDIGYTGLQTDIEEKQVNNLLQGLAIARRTANYPEGARFVWNVEVSWAADLLLQRLPEQYHEEFFDAVRNGRVSVNGMYLNQLTGLCRPEELTRLFRFSTQVAERTGVPIDAAMISDVPGYTWGSVTAMAQAGIRYFSVAPNYCDRIGTILVHWENKPFWWVGPDGKSKVLVWIPFRGYAMSHVYRAFTTKMVEDLCEALRRSRYPYDIAYVRWSGYGDNAVPDPTICEFINEWNATHASPRFVISSTSEAFRAFDERYGDTLPEARGDWTPYWEDGAGSSAAETAMNRSSSDRLTQAETLWAMLAPALYPADRFTEAWNNVLLYSEHTWGAHCSISQPASKFTVDQWDIKKSYATSANLQSRQLLHEAAQVGGGFDPEEANQFIDVFNTTGWPRTEVVAVPVELSGGRRSAVDEAGQPAATQLLKNNDLAILVRDLPPYSGRRYRLVKEAAAPAGAPAATLENNVLSNDRLRVAIDPQTGVSRSGPATIRLHEHGPLVTSVLIESAAEGCHKLVREVRLVTGKDCVELINTVDKKRIAADSYHSREGKESLNFAFPFNVPGGEVCLEAPYSLIRPERDQIASACKNWLTVGRWADVSNEQYGVTWTTLDAPLLQLGELSARLLNSQADPSVWRTTIEPTQKLYSWAMNNHWGTNYRAYQEGPVEFRYVLQPHASRCDHAEATRQAIGFSQPLVVAAGRGAAPSAAPLVEITSDGAVATALKPSDDGRALILRLWCAADRDCQAALKWRSPPEGVWISDASERPLEKADGPVLVPAQAVVTLRAEWPPAGRASSPLSQRSVAAQ